jgi:cytoskeletal protein RodZ
MTIEGLGKKFQEARIARNITLDEAARVTKIRPSRLAEIEADDFSQFPSLAYAKGFLLIYGKFLDVDVTPYMEAFEGSDAMTVDGYSYLQDNPAPKPTRTPVVPRRSRPRPVASSSSSGRPSSLMPLVFAVIVIVVGYSAMRLFLNLQRIAPHRVEPTAAAQASVAAPAPAPRPTIAPPPGPMAAPTSRVVSASPAAAPSLGASVAPTTAPVAMASPSVTPAVAEPEVRRAEPVRPEDLAKSIATESSGPNRVAIRPLKKTYIKVVVDDAATSPAFERWISPSDGPVEFHGQHFAVRILDRDAVQIKKNGKTVVDGDTDVTIE